MKLSGVLVLLLFGYALSSTINNVRLVDHTSYMIDVVTKVVQVVEERGWCNLKLPEHVQELNEDVLNTHMTGTLRYFNGFAVSIQAVDLVQSSVQQVWFHNTTTQITTVTVRGDLRMHSLTVGYDVEANLADGSHRYTTAYQHPLITFTFSVIKNVLTESIDVTVVGSVPNTSLRPVYRPRDNTSEILTFMFNPTTVTSAGIIAWAHEVFEPIVREIVTEQIEFPTICYNCPV